MSVADAHGLFGLSQCCASKLLSATMNPGLIILMAVVVLAACGTSGHDTGFLDEERSELKKLAREVLGEEYGDAYVALALPGARIIHAPTTSGRSHLGGVPRFAPDQAWPMSNGIHLSCLGAIDLAELSSFETSLDLPDEGTLNVFYDTQNEPWGIRPEDRGGWRLILSSAGAAERPTPGGVTEFDLVPVEFEQILTVPGWEENAVDAIRKHDDDAFGRLMERLDQVGKLEFDSRIGGWPTLIQGPVQWDSQQASNRPGNNDEESWRLLVQIDTNDDAGWSWGDFGILYFTMHVDDIAERAYDEAWMVLHSG